MDIPFTIDQFLEVFARYNTAVSPAQWVLLALGFLALFIIRFRPAAAGSLLSALLGLLWLWMGIIYHLLFFSAINPAAYVFGGAFILQGLLFLWAGPFQNQFTFAWQPSTRRYAGYFLVIFGLLLYPLIGLLLGQEGVHIISLGLPCPTTIFTFGLLLLIVRPFPRYLLIIPTIWAVIGFMAALRFGIYQDAMLLVAALTADSWLLLGKD